MSVVSRTAGLLQLSASPVHRVSRGVVSRWYVTPSRVVVGLAMRALASGAVSMVLASCATGGIGAAVRTSAAVRLERPPDRTTCYPATAESAYARRLDGRRVVELTPRGVRLPPGHYESCSIVSARPRATDGTCPGEEIDANMDGCSNRIVSALGPGGHYVLEAAPTGGAQVRSVDGSRTPAVNR